METENPDHVINYTISCLDALSRDKEGRINLLDVLGRLKHLLRETAKRLAIAGFNPDRALVSQETYERVLVEQMYGPQIFDEYDED